MLWQTCKERALISVPSVVFVPWVQYWCWARLSPLIFTLFTLFFQAQETAQLEEQLQGWGEVILAGDQVVRWEKPWFPGALIGATTLVFM